MASHDEQPEEKQLTRFEQFDRNFAHPAANAFRQVLLSEETRLRALLPDGVKYESVGAIGINEVRRNPKLHVAEPLSLFYALVDCIRWGLMPGPQDHVYLVPFKNCKRLPRADGGQDDKVWITEVVAIEGYKGLIHLSKNKGEEKILTPRAVHKKDKFRFFEDETGEHWSHKFPEDNPLNDRGPLVGFYSRAVGRDGMIRVHPMNMDQLLAHREKYVKQLDNWTDGHKDGKKWPDLWRDDGDSDITNAGLKTVIKQHAKTLDVYPISGIGHDAVGTDEDDEGCGEFVNNAVPVEDGDWKDAPTPSLDEVTQTGNTPAQLDAPPDDAQAPPPAAGDVQAPQFNRQDAVASITDLLERLPSEATAPVIDASALGDPPDFSKLSNDSIVDVLGLLREIDKELNPAT